MHSQRFVFFMVALSLFGANFSPGAATLAAAATSAGTLAAATATEGAKQNLGAKLIGVTRTGGYSGAASVHCQTVNGTAIAGKDYTAVSQTLNWKSGETAEKYCSVPVSNAIPFSGQKSFTVKLSAATGATLGNPNSTTVTLYGTRAVGRITLSAATYSVAQNAGAATITINRTGGSSGWAAVYYSTANGTAKVNADFTSEVGRVMWNDGDSSPKTVRIPISNAKPFAGTKTLAFAIAHAQGAMLGTSPVSAIVTIHGTAPAASGTVTLEWTPPTHDIYGASVTELTGYNIYYGKSPSALTSVIAVNNPAAKSYVIHNLAAGTWYFGVKAYNSQADESPLSTVVNTKI
jgi:hypothetical protein